MLVWLAFILLILSFLALDLGVFHRRPRVISVREAFLTSLVWMATALAFAGVVYVAYDQRWFGLGLTSDLAERSHLFPDGRPNDAQTALIKFLTGYVVELSLSVDNVFVIAMLFTYFHVPPAYQHRVLFWGILGALVMRGVMIAVGASLVSQFAWILYVFGGILIVTAIKMWFMGAAAHEPGQNVVVRAIRRFLPVTADYHGEHFFVRERGDRVGQTRLVLTPLALVLVMVETTDLLFAIDSIPAIFAITTDPFLVFTSNVFAILGLRSLYFALAGALHLFRYLRHALAAVLLMVGTKMLAHEWLAEALGPSFTVYLLAAIVLTLALGVAASIAADRAPVWLAATRRPVHTVGHAIEDAVVPDRLLTTLLRAARDAIRRRAGSLRLLPFVACGMDHQYLLAL